MTRDAGLLAISILALVVVSCAPATTHDLQDGWRLGRRGVEQIDATTFSVTVFETGSPKSADDASWYSVSVEMPDTAVTPLPVDFTTHDGSCSQGTVFAEHDTGFMGGQLRVLEPRHQGLLVQYKLECETRTITGRAVFSVQGDSRDSIWPYVGGPPPAKSYAQRIRETLRCAWEGLI